MLLLTVILILSLPESEYLCFTELASCFIMEILMNYFRICYGLVKRFFLTLTKLLPLQFKTLPYPSQVTNQFKQATQSFTCSTVRVLKQQMDLVACLSSSAVSRALFYFRET